MCGSTSTALGLCVVALNHRLLNMIQVLLLYHSSRAVWQKVGTAEYARIENIDSVRV
jgi:hypothetical protein